MGCDHSDALLEHYPRAYRVRLDRETGVCVYTEALGGDTSGAGHSLHIEAVDEPMDDALFFDLRQATEPAGPTRTLSRLFGWSAYPGTTS